MTFKLQPEYEMIKKRFDGFWQCEVVDRALVSIILPKENPKPVPQKTYNSLEEQWLDVEFRAKKIAVELENQRYYGDALPIAFPNMGPEIFSAWCGCPYFFGETTTWSEAAIINWEEDEPSSKLNLNHPLFERTMTFTEELIKLGKDKFIVGLTDFHPGGDHLAALRDPANLAMDMLENVENVKKKLVSSEKEFFVAYDVFYELLKAHDMPFSSWMPVLSQEKFYILSNDFSIMISDEMFKDVFLDGLINECKFYDNSIYHLDGAGALRHLDTLLGIEDLNAIQFVPGAGNEGFEKWIEVYQRIQDAGKAMWIGKIHIDELPLLFANLQPEGIFLDGVEGVHDEATAYRVIEMVKNWSI